MQCEPSVFYTASVILDGNELSYFGQEGMSEVTSGDVIVHFQCSNESTNGKMRSFRKSDCIIIQLYTIQIVPLGTGVQGGQIPELIFYRGSH